MMRPQHSMYMQHGNPQRMAQYGQNIGQRPANMQVTPDGMPMNSDWRHTIMSQQQNMTFNSNGGMRPGFNPNHQGKLFDLLEEQNTECSVQCSFNIE